MNPGVGTGAHFRSRQLAQKQGNDTGRMVN
jgi:hypothetical protein